MIEELQRIDTSAIEELQTIKQEQDVLQQRLDAMHSQAKKVSDKVFERVRADYQGRYHALEEQARPLKAQARAEFARLAALNRRLTEALEDARLAKEELEFRNELGEFEEKAFRQRLAESESLVKECETRVAEGEKLRTRFVAAFHSEDDLTAAPEEIPAPPVEEPATEQPVEEPAAAEPAAAPEAAETGEEPAPDATVLQPLGPEAMDVAGTAPLVLEGAATTPAETGAGEEEKPDAATAILRPARLVQEDDGRVLPVQMPTTTIGRAPSNDVAIPDGTISRHHAKIELTENGFTLFDLGSENGVFVNGERVTERLLANGDQIEVGPGTRRYTFVWE